MLAPTLTGPQYLAQGLKLVLSPGLRLFVLLPLAVNTLLFIGMIALAMQQFGGWVDTFMPGLPSWLSFLEYLLWPLFVVLAGGSALAVLQSAGGGVLSELVLKWLATLSGG